MFSFSCFVGGETPAGRVADFFVFVSSSCFLFSFKTLDFFLPLSLDDDEDFSTFFTFVGLDVFSFSSSWLWSFAFLDFLE